MGVTHPLNLLIVQISTKWAKNGVLSGRLGPKGPLFATKWAKNGVHEEVRSERSTFWGSAPP